jgi:hypothetical protein
MLNNWKIIEQMELINGYINDECQEYLYYSPAINRRIYEKINNASERILNNALRIVRNQKPLIKADNGFLSIENSRNLLFDIYKITLSIDFPIIKERKIKKIIQDKFLINPDDILYNSPSRDIEELKNQRILNGK